VEAGNLYVNRSTTGAIVGRQPFGGWKRSSVGPTAKAGGPNYLLGLRRWHDRDEVGVDAAVAHYRRWWGEYFGRVTEMAGLSCESNQLRYRPFGPGVTVRITDDCPEEEMAKALAAATLTGTPVKVSSSGPRPGWRLPSGTAVAVESGEALAASLASSVGGRLRLLGKAEPEVLAGAAAHVVNVLDEPICSHGRVELVRWLHEQVVTRSLHRYGNIVYEPLTD
jgi:RHH-type proline utilization regulon transcriptional repressor/proline dehydrogenase/delta 1-pyrroline-5-carboxylate dehydrogenase